MHITFTARRFRARPELKAHAVDAVKKLQKFYDGIVDANIILSYEGAEKNIKIAEVNLNVYGSTLSAKEKADDFHKAIDAVLDKVGMRLVKYKSKLRAKDKGKVRAIQEKI